MNINIDIDEKIVNEAQKLSGFKTKKQTVEEALKLFIQIEKQSEIRKYRGTLRRDGDLEKSRNDL